MVKMASKLTLSPGPVISGLYLICTAAFVLAVGYNHMQLITHEVPQGWVEALLDQLDEEVAETEARVA